MRFPAILAVCLLTSACHAEKLAILAWNVESDGNDPNVIVRQLHDLSGYDIVGLMEVKASSIKKYVDALSASGNTFLSVNTATDQGIGGMDLTISVQVGGQVACQCRWRAQVVEHCKGIGRRNSTITVHILQGVRIAIFQ